MPKLGVSFVCKLAIFALPLCLGQGHEPGFAPGWNHQARTPPLGWRSWNAFGPGISDQTIRSAIDAVTARNWTVDGKLVSLADVGYLAVGIDEGWEGCGQGVNGTQHDANGIPVVNNKFPDMKKLVDYGHARGVKMGWYLNGCACGEKQELEINYQGDVKMLDQYGFDAVKIDGCGHQRNNTKYAALMKATGKDYAIENCHWCRRTQAGRAGGRGAMNSIGCHEGDDGSACPSLDWCPFNWYRTSGDINKSPDSWFANLQTVIPYTGSQPLSQPSCWGYPDMLEVGLIQKPNSQDLDLPWNQAHFGAWCVVSSPLYLGLDLTKSAQLAQVIPIITNPEALSVNQQWAGHPGKLLSSVDPAQAHPDAQGFLVYPTGALAAGSDLHVANMTLPAAEAWCKAEQACKGFTSRLGQGSQRVYFKSEVTQRNTDDGWTSYVKQGDAPAGPQSQQLWAKPQPGGAWAVLAINGQQAATMSASLKLSQLGLHGPVKVRDIWARKDAGLTGADSFEPPAVPPRSSGFYLLSPQ